MIGYSGGAIATEWAAELAHSYARPLSKRLVGASFGGVLAEPAHNLHYVEGSLIWAGVIPMALDWRVAFLPDRPDSRHTPVERQLPGW
jgi:Secretory lipase